MEKIARDLEQHGYSLSPGFFGPDLIRELQNDLASLREGGRLRRAGLGPAKNIRDDIRRDEIYWLKPDSTNAIQLEFLDRMDKIRNILNEKLFLGLRSQEFHYAHYPPGGFYVKHWDNFHENHARAISIVLYLNSEWQESDGGKLRMYLPSGPVDIDPVGGSLVCFLSDEIEHEVLQSHSPRSSLTGWFKTL